MSKGLDLCEECLMQQFPGVDAEERKRLLPVRESRLVADLHGGGHRGNCLLDEAQVSRWALSEA